MAETAQGAALTRAHRAAQIAIGTETAELLRRTWPLLDLTNLDRSQRQWLNTVLPLVVDGRLKSIRTAEAYLRAFSTVEVGAPMVVVAPAVTDEVREAVLTSMRTTGPVTVKSLTASGYSLSQVGSTALTAVMGAGLRHALDGGRETAVQSIREDPRAQGWRRITDGNACKFCRMLAGRGEVYGSEQAVDFASHDNCGCEAEPAWGGERISVRQFVASQRTSAMSPEQREKHRARVREFLASMDDAA